jgi:hypothetical protein
MVMLLLLLVIPAQAGIHFAFDDSQDIGIKIVPLRIRGFDQFDFPHAFPCLEGFLSPNGGFHSFVDFVPDQIVDPMTLGEPVSLVILMLEDASGQVGGDADIERAAWATGQDVNAW